MDLALPNLDKKVRLAVKHFWQTREAQSVSQKQRGSSDQGARAAVTGGAQMDGFIKLIAELVKKSGISDACIYTKQKLVLPGYFRASKEWDLLIVSNQTLLAVIETKSQVGSFGNNFNNRTEEAIGSAVDLWTAYREGAFADSTRPWLGYLFLLEDCAQSAKPVSVKEPHFNVFEVFRDASYGKRYEILLRRLVRERHYEAAAFLLSDSVNGQKGKYKEPTKDLCFRNFARSLCAHAAAYSATQEEMNK